MRSALLFLVVLLMIAALEAVGNVLHDSELPFQLEERVVNGQHAEQHEWPWQVLLLFKGRAWCGGSLIRDDWVVTAAHCVANRDVKNFKVVVGAHAGKGTTNVQQSFHVKKVIVHEDYSPELTHKNDIALLKLSSLAKITEKVRPIELPTPGHRIAVGTTCYITGWGRESVKGQPPSVLQEAHIRIGSHDDCQNTFKKLNRSVDKTSMICAGGQGKGGGCYGDSGGPLSCNEDGQWTLRGVVSWGHEECLTTHHTVFARVSNFVYWIEDIIGEADCGTLLCFNGGTASCFHGIPYCECLLGYGGYQCQWGKCRSLPCHNGGTKYCSVGRSFCDCLQGYSGRQCQDSGLASTPKPTIQQGEVTRVLLELIRQF